MPAGLYFRHESSLDHDTGAHPENKARIPAIEGELEQRGWLGYERRSAPAAEIDQLTRVHTLEHVEGVRRVAEQGGGWLDIDTIASPGSWEAALHAAGGACAMVDALMTGEAEVAFAGLRPPGHHCEVARAMGFCLFNNVAIAARQALEVHDARRVAIFDWDVHHGNGTNDIFHASREVLYVSIHQSPLYPGTGPLGDVGSGSGEGYTLNLPVPPGSGEDVWLSLTTHVVAPVLRTYGPDVVLVSAGYDAHRADPLADCRLEIGSYAKMAALIRALAADLGVPLGAVLEGGYALDALATSVAATLEAFAGSATPDADSYRAEPVTARAVEVISRYWPVAV
jgi:acetoin utilization deacetylase AcuC-like enzyme